MEELLIIVRPFPPYLYLGIFSSLEFAILQYMFVHLHFFLGMEYYPIG